MLCVWEPTASSPGGPTDRLTVSRLHLFSLFSDLLLFPRPRCFSSPVTMLMYICPVAIWVNKLWTLSQRRWLLRLERENIFSFLKDSRQFLTLFLLLRMSREFFIFFHFSWKHFSCCCAPTAVFCQHLFFPCQCKCTQEEEEVFHMKTIWFISTSCSQRRKESFISTRGSCCCQLKRIKKETTNCNYECGSL